MKNKERINVDEELQIVHHYDGTKIPNYRKSVNDYCTTLNYNRYPSSNDLILCSLVLSENEMNAKSIAFRELFEAQIEKEKVTPQDPDLFTYFDKMKSKFNQLKESFTEANLLKGNYEVSNQYLWDLLNMLRWFSNKLWI